MTGRTSGGGPDVMKRRTFVTTVRLPRFGALHLIDVDGKKDHFRNPVFIGMQWKKQLQARQWRERQSEVGPLQTRSEFGATVGVSGFTVRDYLYLATLDDGVRALFLSLGGELPEGCVISKAGVRRLVKLPNKEQMRQARLLIEKAGIELPEELE